MNEKDIKLESTEATLVLTSPNGQREYLHGDRKMLERMLDKEKYVTDGYGFRWFAFFED